MIFFSRSYYERIYNFITIHSSRNWKNTFFCFPKKEKKIHTKKKSLFNKLVQSTHFEKMTLHSLMWLSSLQTLSPLPQRSTIFNFHRNSNDRSNLPKYRIVRSTFSRFHVSANGSDIVEQENSRRSRVIPTWLKVKPVLSCIIRSTTVTPRTWWRGEEVKNPWRIKNREGILYILPFSLFKLSYSFSCSHTIPCEYF